MGAERTPQLQTVIDKASAAGRVSPQSFIKAALSTDCFARTVLIALGMEEVAIEAAPTRSGNERLSLAMRRTLRRAQQLADERTNEAAQTPYVSTGRVLEALAPTVTHMTGVDAGRIIEEIDRQAGGDRFSRRAIQSISTTRIAWSDPEVIACSAQDMRARFHDQLDAMAPLTIEQLAHTLRAAHLGDKAAESIELLVRVASGEDVGKSVNDIIRHSLTAVIRSHDRATTDAHQELVRRAREVEDARAA